MHSLPTEKVIPPVAERYYNLKIFSGVKFHNRRPLPRKNGCNRNINPKYITNRTQSEIEIEPICDRDHLPRLHKPRTPPRGTDHHDQRNVCELSVSGPRYWNRKTNTSSDCVLNKYSHRSHIYKGYNNVFSS